MVSNLLHVRNVQRGFEHVLLDTFGEKPRSNDSLDNGFVQILTGSTNHLPCHIVERQSRWEESLCFVHAGTLTVSSPTTHTLQQTLEVYASV